MSPDALAVVVPDKAAGASLRPGGLPPGWCLSTLGEVASINPTTAFDGLANDAEIPFIPMTAVAEETGIIDASRRRSVAEVRKGYVRFCEGDVIFAKITPCMENGKTAPVIGIPGGYAAGSTEFHVLRPEAVEPRYLWYWLVRHAFRHEAERNMSGSAGQLRVPVDYLRKSPVSVAPLAEQRRIVARIDELFAEIAEGEAALERARQGLDTWRRALLKAAVTGELTRDWREANRPTETGTHLLARIRAKRGASFPRGSRTRQRAPSESPVSDLLPQLPEGWAWATLGECISHLTSGSRDWSQYYDRGSAIFIMAQNIRPGRYNHNYVKHVAPPAGDPETTRTRVCKNDLLVTIVGANTGDVCRVDFGATNYFVCQSVALARPILSEISEFLELYFVAREGGRGEFEKVIYGAGRPHLSFDQLLATRVPIPSLVEMREIVQRVRLEEEAAFSEQESAGFHRDLVALRQAILKAAFEGRLVSQDTTDEPASVLLARLRDGYSRNGAPRRRARAAAEFSHPSLPGLTRQPVDPRVTNK